MLNVTYRDELGDRKIQVGKGTTYQEVLDRCTDNAVCEASHLIKVRPWNKTVNLDDTIEENCCITAVPRRCS